MLTLPSQVHTALDRLTAAGWEAYVVGGAVRDALRGCAAGDWDITTNAEPAQVERVFAGERLIEIIAEAWTDCGCTFAAFLDQVPADCPHDLMMVQIVYVIRRADKATGGQPEYVDTEVRDIYVDRCDPTPAGS